MFIDGQVFILGLALMRKAHWCLRNLYSQLEILNAIYFSNEKGFLSSLLLVNLPNVGIIFLEIFGEWIPEWGTSNVNKEPDDALFVDLCSIYLSCLR